MFAAWHRHLNIADLVAMLLAPIAILLVCLIFPPTGEFPILDDWDYRATVADLLLTGEIRISDWPAMPLVTNVLWGGLFAACFGASYFVLRISTLVSLACTAIILHRLLTKRGVPSLSASFVCLSFCLSPIVWLMSHSFMTDVPAMLWMLLPVLIMHSSSFDNSNEQSFAGWFWLTAIAIVGFLGRQTAALPVLFFASYHILMRRQFRVILSFVMPFALAVYAYYQLSSSIALPYATSLPLVDLSILLKPEALGIRLARILLTLSFFASPLLLGHLLPSVRRSWVCWCAGLALAILASWCSPSSPFDSSFSDLGPALDRGRFGFDQLARPAIFLNGHLFYWIDALSRLVAVLSAATLLESCFSQWKKLALMLREPCSATLLLTAAAGIGQLIVSVQLHERYLIPVIAFGIVIWSEHLAPRQRVGRTPWLVLLVLGLFSVLGTRDYFHRQNAFWQAAVSLVEQDKVSAQDINAGFEFGGVYRFSPAYRNQTSPWQRPFLMQSPPAQRKYLLSNLSPLSDFVASRRFLVSYAKPDNASLIRTYQYRSMLNGNRTSTVYVTSRLADKPQ